MGCRGLSGLGWVSIWSWGMKRQVQLKACSPPCNSLHHVYSFPLMSTQRYLSFLFPRATTLLRHYCRCVMLSLCKNLELCFSMFFDYDLGGISLLTPSTKTVLYLRLLCCWNTLVVWNQVWENVTKSVHTAEVAGIWERLWVSQLSFSV